MRHTRKSVMERAVREFKALDRTVTRLKPAEWRLLVPRSETKDPWTVKDALVHITYWKWGVVLAARGEHLPPDMKGLNITEGNRRIYLRWRRRPTREVLAWHRQVQKELLSALRAAPSAWFTRKSRGENWPYDADGHSADHRIRDIERALSSRRPKKAR